MIKIRITEQRKKDLGNLVKYLPQGRANAKYVLSNPACATLRETIYVLVKYPQLINPSKLHTTWTNTVVLYDTCRDGKEINRWIDGPIEIIDKFTYKPLGKSTEGRLYLPQPGFVKAVKEGRKWIAWDFRENGGFPREATENREEALDSFRQAGIEVPQRFISYLERKPAGKHGIVPVSRFRARKKDASLSIDADWDFQDFDKTHLEYVLIKNNEPQTRR